MAASVIFIREARAYRLKGADYRAVIVEGV
jgi:hypothetical protein